MFCPKCGNEIQGNAKFCGKCGAVLNSAAPEAGRPLYHPEEEMPMPDQRAASGGAKTSKTARAEAGIAAQKVIASAGNTASGIWSNIQKWLTDYLDTWRQLQKLGEKEKYLWFGIHGGVVLLLLCVIIMPVFFGKVSGGFEGKTDIGKILEEVIEDKELSEEDITRLAQAVSDYEDCERLESVYWEGVGSGVYQEVEGYLNVEHHVYEKCRDLSGLGALIGEYGAWYDQDGLAEKIFGKPDSVEYIYWDNSGGILPISARDDGDAFRSDADGNYVKVEWFAFADSDEITIIKSTSMNGEKAIEQFDGKFEISGTELVVTLDGKEYRLSEAATDLARKQEESFYEMSKGTWAYSAEFHDMIASNFSSWEKFKNPYNVPPLYLDFHAPGGDMVVRGVDGIYLENIYCDYEQGEGKTVTIILEKDKSIRLEASYDKVGSNLVITVNGIDYTLNVI